MDKYLPGTNIPYGSKDDATSNLKMMVNAADGLSLSQICAITGLEESTIQNWVKRGFLFRPIKKKYKERHLGRIMLIMALRSSMLIEDIAELMSLINGNLEDESDDIISDMNLYEYFSRSVRDLESIELSPEDVEEMINNTLQGEKRENINKLSIALRIMIYAYISSRCKKVVQENLNYLKED